MVPEDGQASRQPKHARRLAGIGQETQGRAEVGELGLDGPEAIVDALTRRNVVRFEPRIEGGEVRRMRRPCPIRSPAQLNCSRANSRIVSNMPRRRLAVGSRHSSKLLSTNEAMPSSVDAAMGA